MDNFIIPGKQVFQSQRDALLRRKAESQAAFTAIELMMTLAIVAALGMMVMPNLLSRHNQSADQITRVSMAQLRDAVMDHYRSDMFETLPFPVDSSRVAHPQLKYLYENPTAVAAANPTSIEAIEKWDYDPVAMRGWSGPYIQERSRYQVNTTAGFTDRYGEMGDATPVDGWLRPIVLQQPVVVGAGYSATSVNYARLVSAGEDGVLQTPANVLEPTVSQLGDDIVVRLRGI